MNEIARESLLFDYYGDLLTEKMRRVMALYQEENLTLAEIAEQTGVSRAAVYDSLKKAEKKLEDYDRKLGLIRRADDVRQTAADAIGILDRIEEKNGGEDIRRDIGEIRKMLTALQENS